MNAVAIEGTLRCLPSQEARQPAIGNVGYASPQLDHYFIAYPSLEWRCIRQTSMTIMRNSRGSTPHCGGFPSARLLPSLARDPHEGLESTPRKSFLRLDF